MKKFFAVFCTAVMSVACLFAFVACGDKKEENPPEELIADIHGRFTYEENGNSKDANGATWEFYIDSGNKFHLFGALAHSDNTESYIEFEGQVTNIVMSEMYVECAQVMFFTYKYHGVAYSPKDSGASAVTSSYKSAWKEGSRYERL